MTIKNGLRKGPLKTGFCQSSRSTDFLHQLQNSPSSQGQSNNINRGGLTPSGAPRHTLVWGPPHHTLVWGPRHTLVRGPQYSLVWGPPITLWFGGPPPLRDGKEQNEVINNRSLCHTSRPTHLRGPAALTLDKNCFSGAPSTIHF